MTQSDPLRSARRVIFIVNPASGSVPEDAAETLSAAWQELELSPALEVRDIAGGDVAEEIRAAVEAGPDMLGVWGGDGTMACALTQAADAGQPVLVLPGGTMNLLPRRLFDDDTNWRTCLERLSQGARLHTLPAGQVDGQRFFVAAMFGDLAGLSEAREALRNGELGKAAENLLSGDAFSLSPKLQLDIAPLAGPSSQREATAASVVVGAEGGSSLLELALLEAGNILELGAVGLETLLRGWRDADSLEIVKAGSVAVTYGGDGPLPCTLDGEKVDLMGRSVFTLIPDVADVLVPAS